MVGDYFETDTHTLADGALQRFLKMRKWLVLTGALLVLLDSKLLDFQRLTAALFVPTLSANTVHWSITIAGVYQAAMLVFVLVQLCATYRESLGKRRGWKYRLPIWRSADLRNERAQIQAEIDDPISSFGDEEPVTALTRREKRIESIGAEIPKQIRYELTVIWPEIAVDLMRVLPTVGFFFWALIFQGAW
jgi:hypothetical protein